MSQELISWQRRLFRTLEEFFRRAYAASIQDVTPNFDDWIRAQASQPQRDLADAFAWCTDELAALYRESHARNMFGLAKQFGGVKLVLGGSSHFTEGTLGTVRKVALYADTVLIPDPILPWIEDPRREERFPHVHLTKNAYWLLHLKPLVDAELPYPPVVVFPSWERSLESQSAATQLAQKRLVTGVLSTQLGHDFLEPQELAEFVEQRPDEFLECVNRRKLFIGPGGEPGEGLEESLRRYKEHIATWRSTEYRERLTQFTEADLVLLGITERFGPIHHLLENAGELIANPTLPLRVHWHYYQLCSRFFEGSLERLGALDHRVIAEVRALAEPANTWLGDVTIEGLVLLRERGENEVFRRRLQEFTSSLQEAAFEDLGRVAGEVSRGLASLLREHDRAIRQIQEKYIRSDIHTVLLAGVTAAATLVPTLAPVIGAGGLLTPLGKFLWDRVSEQLDLKQASRSMVGVLAEARERRGG